MPPQRSRRPKEGFEKCAHTCVAGGCISRDTSCVLWHRERGSCPGHVRSKGLHRNCDETCPGYEFLKGKGGRGTVRPTQEDLSRYVPWIHDQQQQLRNDEFAPAHELNMSRRRAYGMKLDPSDTSSSVPASAPVLAPIPAPIPTPVGEQGLAPSPVLELLSSARPNLEAFHPHFVKMGITDGNALWDLLSWPVHVQERMLRVELGGAMSALQLYGLMAAMHQWKESH